MRSKKNMFEVTNTRVSNLTALDLNVLSPLEQNHLMGGTNLTVTQQQQQQQQQNLLGELEDFLAI
jgi:hypothetical protein